jgi:hypothetical protein
VVGRVLRYIVEYQGQWLALIGSSGKHGRSISGRKLLFHGGNNNSTNERGQCQINVRVTTLTQHRGKPEEKQVAIPIQANVVRGRDASALAGGDKEAGSVDVSWPDGGGSAYASCTITVTQRGKTVSRSKVLLKLEKAPKV